MKVYIGTKVIQAEPMTRGRFEEAYPGVLKGTNASEEEGYAVRYANKYVSWSPKDVFESAYREVSVDETNLILSAMIANTSELQPAPALTPGENPVEVPSPNPPEGAANAIS